MIQTKIYDGLDLSRSNVKDTVVSFLHEHLEEYGDQLQDIAKAYDYVTGVKGSAGGKLVVAYNGEEVVGSAIINRTGMEGYIPENILVYIATHRNYRGKGVAGTMMQEIIANCDGNIALHVEPDNPALRLYQKFGFANKYLEMRLIKRR